MVKRLKNPFSGPHCFPALIVIQEDITCCHHQLCIKIVCATKDEKRLKSTAISVTPTVKANRRNRDSQRNGNEETGARYGGEIAD